MLKGIILATINVLVRCTFFLSLVAFVVTCVLVGLILLGEVTPEPLMPFERGGVPSLQNVLMTGSRWLLIMLVCFFMTDFTGNPITFGDKKLSKKKAF